MLFSKPNNISIHHLRESYPPFVMGKLFLRKVKFYMRNVTNFALRNTLYVRFNDLVPSSSGTSGNKGASDGCYSSASCPKCSFPVVVPVICAMLGCSSETVV